MNARKLMTLDVQDYDETKANNRHDPKKPGNGKPWDHRSLAYGLNNIKTLLSYSTEIMKNGMCVWRMYISLLRWGTLWIELGFFILFFFFNFTSLLSTAIGSDHQGQVLALWLCLSSFFFYVSNINDELIV